MAKTEAKAAEIVAEETEAKAAEKIYIVETPVKGFCGVGAGGVQFAYGKAEVRPGWVLEWFREHGYIITEKQ